MDDMNSPSSSNLCPRCGSGLQAHGLCPKCLMAQAAMATESPTLPIAPADLPSQQDLAAAFPELEVVEVIGRGGMGVVYKARQKSLNRLVALKLLAPERVRDPQFAARFAKEAQALAALSHPNIVTVHDFGQAGGFYFLLMEFVDGVNLRQAMTAGRFTSQQALAIVPPVCEALQYAHEHGIVHRDIKPENLLLDKDGRVKIADFGIAKMLGSEASEILSQPAGTPRYMAPEQQNDPQHVDHRADIYSLGVVLYELLTGEAPGSQLRPPSQTVRLDVRLDEVVLRALNEKPELRWQTAVELRTQVQTIVQTPPALPPQVEQTPQQRLFHAMGYHTAWGQRLLILSLIGCLGFLGFIPGLLSLRILTVLFALMAVAAVVEKAHAWQQHTPARTWVHKVLWIGLLVLLFVIALHTWVLEAFVIKGRSIEPEAPTGSHILVWKLWNAYAPGDIVAYRHGEQTWVARVVSAEGRHLTVVRNTTPAEVLPLKDIIGKVVSVYWRTKPQPVVLRTFHSLETALDTKAVPTSDGAWLVTATQPQVVQMFEHPLPLTDDCVVFYRARLKAENLEGKAFLEMWCRLPGKGEFFSRGLDRVLSGTTDWMSFETPFFLKKGEKADLLKLGLSIQGKGKVWIKDIEIHAQGAGVQPVTKATTPEPAPKTLGPSTVDLDKKPVFRYLQLYQKGDEHNSPVFNTDGELVGQERDVYAVHASQFHKSTMTPSNADDVYMRLWFEHPSWDPKSELGVTVTLPDGSPLPNVSFSGSGAVWPGSPARPAALSATRCLGKQGQLPPAVRVTLRYSMGLWSEGYKVKTDFRGSASLGRGAMLGGLGTNNFGRAFINWMRPDKVQLDAVAQLKDGRVLDATTRMTGGAEPSGSATDSAEFPATLDAVESFQTQYRDVREVVFENVRLPAPDRARPSTVGLDALDLLQKKRKAAAAMLGENHPDVIALDRQIEALTQATGTTAQDRVEAVYRSLTFLKSMEAGKTYDLPVGANGRLSSTRSDFERRRTGAEVLDSGVCADDFDYALAIIDRLTAAGLQCHVLECAEVSLRSLENPVYGRVLVDVHSTDGKHAWLLRPEPLLGLRDCMISVGHGGTESKWWPEDRWIDNFNVPYVIAYAGSAQNYKLRGRDGVNELRRKALAVVNSPTGAFQCERTMVKCRIKLDASLFDVAGRCLNPQAEKLAELQEILLQKHGIKLNREADVTLYAGKDDTQMKLSHWGDTPFERCTVGLRSQCGPETLYQLQTELFGKLRTTPAGNPTITWQDPPASLE